MNVQSAIRGMAIRPAVKEAAIPGAIALSTVGKAAKSVVGRTVGLGSAAVLLMFGVVPALAGGTAGILQSKITSPDKEELERLQQEAITNDLAARKARLESLPPRKDPKHSGKDALWRP